MTLSNQQKIQLDELKNGSMPSLLAAMVANVNEIKTDDLEEEIDVAIASIPKKKKKAKKKSKTKSKTKSKKNTEKAPTVAELRSEITRLEIEAIDNQRAPALDTMARIVGYMTASLVVAVCAGYMAIMGTLVFSFLKFAWIIFTA